MKESEFQEIVWEKGRELYRTMPWREDMRPYYVLVSELMLQQTQVDRVIPKFNDFIQRFPDEESLASASLADVLRLWTGLGYNRRAKYLHEAAKAVVSNFGGVFPNARENLTALPGVGPGTAGAILTYAFNQPVPFIETNVRTVYFYHFFEGQPAVSDKELVPVVERTIDREHPREFYWALMDYGTWLKKNGAGKNSQSAHYKKQSPLRGSVREVRGQIVAALAAKDLRREELAKQLAADERFEGALAGLLVDGLVQETKNRLHLTK